MRVKLINSKKTVLISCSDLPLVEKYNWRITKEGYAQTKIYIKGSRKKFGSQRYKTIQMHRLIMGAKEGQVVDHINRNRLDNRRNNLRFCDYFIHTKNSDKKSSNKSGYKGVHYHKSTKKWRAQTMMHGERRELGLFDNPIEAAIAYDNANRERYGDSIYLNFRNGGYDHL